MAEVAIGPLSQIPPGEGRNFQLGQQTIAVFHTRGGAVFATQAACPHRAGPLADGLIDEASVICPLHERMFSFASGSGIGNDCALTIYPARLDSAGMILLTTPGSRDLAVSD
jgi:nitrite reductase (NADH) small subunit